MRSLTVVLGAIFLTVAPLAGQDAMLTESPDEGLALPRGLVLTPSLAVLGFYDDNVFVTARAPLPSAGGRLTAGLAASVPAGRDLSLRGSYNISSDWFAEFRELDDLIAAQSASLALEYRAGRRSRISLLGGYSMSRTPQDVLPEVGLAFRRGGAERYSAGFGANREIGRDGRIGFTYTYTRLVSERNPGERASEGWSAQWTQKIARRTALSISGGVTNIEGSFTPRYSVSLSHARRSASLSLGYSRRDYAIPTLEGSAASESLTAGIGLRIGRDLSVRVSPRASQSADSLRLVRTLSLGATVSYALGRWVSLTGSYRGWIQRSEESTVLGELNSPELQHQLVYFGVAFGRPFRLR